ncbi:MAG: aldo/keto reductase [Candidatus Latescibacterota bacterium]|nr:MAG: aldo/keto reductase [Candidatus Latescibacterota bacterium]
MTLRGGVEIPRLGLGVYQTGAGAETRNAVECALACGYRHIDTARIYNNERDVGAAIRASSVPRDEIFVTSKLWNADHGRSKTLRACEASLERLGVDSLDLFLVHWPVQELRGETWEAMVDLLESGRCRAIGVSNYMLRHMRELLAASPVIPAVNQVECSPFLTQTDIRDLCREQGIVVEAYSPLTKGRRLQHPTLREIASSCGRTPAQVLIRWGLQHDLVVLPKSANPDRIRENADVFDFALAPEEMSRLDALDENLHTGWDPTDAP